MRHALPGWQLVDLERPADQGLLTADLEGYLSANPKSVIFDEAQRLPELFPALRHAIDNGRGRGRYVLLGSASPTLLRSTSETFAGRIAVLELTPFLPSELATGRLEKDRWFRGGFPPARRLRRLWEMLTHVYGSLLNVSDLARSLAVWSHTVAQDLYVLEGAFMIRRLQPFHANVPKRLTKSPKLYVRDTGLLHFLAGLREPRELNSWPKRGHSFEGLVIEQLVALAERQFVRPEFFFWRTQAGAEVDLLIKAGRRILPVEIIPWGGVRTGKLEL